MFKPLLTLKVTDYEDGWLVEDPTDPSRRYQETYKMVEPAHAIGEFFYKYAVDLDIVLDITTKYDFPLRTAEEYGCQRIPVIGEKVYVGDVTIYHDESTYPNPHGGVATVSAMFHTKYSMCEKGALMVEVNEHPRWAYDWANCEKEQDELKATYGDTLATEIPEQHMICHT